MCTRVCVYGKERETTVERDRERWLDKRTVLKMLLLDFHFSSLQMQDYAQEKETAKQHTKNTQKK